MIGSIRSRLTFANVTSLLALFVALGGSSYAALNLPKGSVGGKHLRKNAVTSPKVKPGSLLLSDFRRSQRAALRGPAGAVGLQGPPGAQGTQGPAGRGVLEPLRSGETITGGFWLQARAAVGAEVEADFIPLGALTQDPITTSDAFYNGIGVEPCTGTADAPTAPPGVLCVYTTASVNVANRTLANVITTDAARRRGFSALITSAAAGEYGLVAVWAYTEP
jgi:hypothetical protein